MMGSRVLKNKKGWVSFKLKKKKGLGFWPTSGGLKIRRRRNRDTYIFLIQDSEQMEPTDLMRA